MTTPDILYREVDHLKSEPDALPSLLETELRATDTAMLIWVARRPRKNWHQGIVDWKPHVTTTAPQYEQIVWLRSDCTSLPSEDFEEECRRLLSDYKPLFEGNLPIDECPAFNRYKKLLTSHIRNQEKETFPWLTERLPVTRAVRELGYEHLGLERGLKTLEDALKKSRAGALAKADRDRLDLDFYHLLEHHIERERDEIAPLIDFLQGVYRTGSTCYNPPHPSRSDVAQR